MCSIIKSRWSCIVVCLNADWIHGSILECYLCWECTLKLGNFPNNYEKGALLGTWFICILLLLTLNGVGFFFSHLFFLSLSLYIFLWKGKVEQHCVLRTWKLSLYCHRNSGYWMCHWSCINQDDANQRN